MDERDAAAPDWEVLSMSMSMSASTFANPNPRSAKTGDKPAPKSLFRYPVLDASNPSPEDGSALATSNWTNPFHECPSGDGADKIAGGHMPQPYPHVHGYCEENIGHPDLEAESLLQADPFMAASQELAKETAEYILGRNMGADQAPKKKARRSRSVKVVWTLAVAATIIGFVMLGRRVQAELYQNQQLQLELSIKDEKLDDLAHQASSLKDLLRRHYTARSSAF